MSRIKEQNQRMREAARAKLLESAITLFATRGYNSTSVRAIAKQTEVSVGLLYYYCADEQQLLEAVFQTAMDRLRWYNPASNSPTFL